MCSGGITADVAERLCGPDALDLASRLVDRSLLVADTGGGAVRFTMLESLRAFGLARLAEDAELEAARTEHLDWCIEFATRCIVKRADQTNSTGSPASTRSTRTSAPRSAGR